MRLSHEAALQELDRNRQQLLLLQNILESPHGVIFFSLDRAYRYTSFARAHAQTMQHIWGATIDIGTCMLDVIRDDADRQKAKTNFDAALAGENLLLEEEYGDAELQRTYWENRYSPLYDGTGHITGLTVFVTDITERRQAAERLAQTQEELRASLETQLKQLRGIIPICSYCKKIRADDHSWERLEEYISAHSDALFSHGICPTCVENLDELLEE
ncbi:MAG: PAS domain-containing protein [Gemmatimonadaceae bacterium]|nr:PAS domain-containing protein [Gemmatimonadaceae bacterium]